MIDITGTDLRKFIAKAYELSRLQGLGILHFQPGPLSEDMIDHIIEEVRAKDGADGIVLSMDYVSGRAVKMTIRRKNGRLLINDRWFDHSAVDLQDLLAADGIANNGATETSHV